MRRSLRVILLTIIITLLMGLSTYTVGATDIWPDLLEASFEAEGEGMNMISGDYFEIVGEGTPLTVFDETANGFFLRVDPATSPAFFVDKYATDALARLIKEKEKDPTFDMSFAWELMIRLPAMPANLTEGSGWYASGGFDFQASDTQGHFMIESGTNDANSQRYYLNFDMEANKWYHCVMVYDDINHQFYAYVNGERAKTDDGQDSVTVNSVHLSYSWHWGLQIGGGHIDRQAALIAQDIAICNLYSQVIPEEDIMTIYEDAAYNWGLNLTNSETPEPSLAPDPTSTPENQENSETTTPETSATTNDSSESNSSSAIIVIAIVAAAVIIAGGVFAGILVVRKK